MVTHLDLPTLRMNSHGITAAVPTHPTTSRVPTYTDYMAQFNGHSDNLAVATTNSGAVLDQLAVTTTTHYTEIKALLTALKTASSPIS